MKKRFLSTMLMGALVVASTSMVTSCKDYDDEVNDLQTQIDALSSSLSSTKTSLESSIASLKSELETAEGTLATLTSQVNTNTSAISGNKSAIEANATAITNAVARIASLESRISTAETALENVNALLANKVDKSEYNTKVAELVGQIEAVQTGLSSALTQIDNNKTELTQALNEGLNNATIAINGVKADVEQQQTALNNYLTRLQALETAGISNDVKEYITAQITSLKNGELKTLSDNLAALQEKLNGYATKSDLTTLATKTELEAVKTSVKDANDQIDALKAQINVLNVLLDQKLRSLVFIPQSYYWGIEATSLNYLTADSYYYDANKNGKKDASETFPAASYDKKEYVGYSDDSRYPTVNVTKILSFAATYHMNPSSAKLDDNAVVKVLSNDLVYENTRAAQAGLSVKSWSQNAGVLTVNLDATNPEKIKSVLDDKMVTNFAVQANVNTANGDTTVTSDYATLYANTVSGLKLALKTKKAGNTALIDGAPVTDLSVCENAAGCTNSYAHLMQTVHEAGVTKTPQEQVLYNSTLDLRTLVNVHWTNLNGTHAEVDAATIAANFDYKFELTAFYKGDNATDESAHAAIADDGYTFRPQAVDANGKQQQYGAEQNRATLVGRTPVVRISLIDKQTGVVYDYGYVRILIVDETTVAQEKADEYIEYTGAGYSYNGECTPAAWSYSTKWYITEADLYKKLGLTREEFEKNYGAPVGDENDLTQYDFNASTKKFTERVTKIGVASTVTDEVASEDGTMSSTLKWELTSAQAQTYIVNSSSHSAYAAIKYESKDKTVGPDVYVIFRTGAYTSTTPSAVVNWNAIKNSTYWAATNASSTGGGLDEIHMNVPSVEDLRTTEARPFEQVFANNFVGNTINVSSILTITDNTPKKEFAVSNLTFDLVWDKSNVGHEYKGISGKTYVLSLSADAKTLLARVKGQTATQAVAVISGTDVNSQKASYQETEYAKDLLNNVAHDKLDNNTLTAIVGIKAVNKCNKELPLTSNTFNVRFLRPLNITNTTAEVTDAATTELQTIKLIDLLTFTDWRDAWKDNYLQYYGVESVSIEGVADGEKISTNSAVLTDQNGQTTMKSLGSINGAVDFTYSSADMGTLTYRNYSSTAETFHVQIPVVVKYIWGNVPQTITVTVHHTVNNAK